MTDAPTVLRRSNAVLPPGLAPLPPLVPTVDPDTALRFIINNDEWKRQL